MIKVLTEYLKYFNIMRQDYSPHPDLRSVRILGHHQPGNDAISSVIIAIQHAEADHSTALSNAPISLKQRNINGHSSRVLVPSSAITADHFAASKEMKAFGKDAVSSTSHSSRSRSKNRLYLMGLCLGADLKSPVLNGLTEHNADIRRCFPKLLVVSTSHIQST